MQKIRIKRKIAERLVKRLDENFETMMDTALEPFFREQAEMLYKEVLFRLALIQIPVERDEKGKHSMIQPQARRSIFLHMEEELLENINQLYLDTLAGKDAHAELKKAVETAKIIGIEVELQAGGYDFKNQYTSIFTIIPAYTMPKRAQREPRDHQKEKG